MTDRLVQVSRGAFSCGGVLHFKESGFFSTESEYGYVHHFKNSGLSSPPAPRVALALALIHNLCSSSEPLIRAVNNADWSPDPAPTGQSSGGVLFTPPEQIWFPSRTGPLIRHPVIQLRARLRQEPGRGRSRKSLQRRVEVTLIHHWQH